MDRLAQSDVRFAERYRIATRTLPADLLTPVRAARCLRAAGHRVCLLESVDGPGALAHHTFCALDPEGGLRSDDNGVRLVEHGEERSVRGSTFEALRDLSGRLRLPVAPGNPPLFHGGLIGYLGHECVAELEPSVSVPEQDSIGAPRAAFDAYRTVLAFDHRAQTLRISTTCRGGASEFDAAIERLDAIEPQLMNMAPPAGATSFECDALDFEEPAEHFLDGVDRLQRAIAAGEIFQAVLSRRRSGSFSGDPFELYRALRVTNGAPHMVFFETDEVTLVGSSPERLVAVRDGRMHTVPIAGTRPIGADARETADHAAALLSSAKERSEHDMLVDMARNDLGRVARVGSVELVEHARCQRFRRVQHLVSRVEADVHSERDAIDVLASCFTAGTVSGAPKVRALQLIAKCEGERRGPFGGAFGYVDHSGGLDMAIAIRTFVACRGRLSLQAGAGIVHGSDPRAELAEVDAKMSGPLAALDLLRAARRDSFDQVGTEVMA
ncbi:Anthranilate synthase component 1 [Planctomycetes bacterium Pla163]|uniref:Anthranilate synthase component 1 n=1 Tax=Rohdeia mirabilis TaxID=2528008 RepID=A0A518CYU9_9BACT|nr:Anthranilate synthase component 1 [Planctomycetes bacterium Pla163]